MAKKRETDYTLTAGSMRKLKADHERLRRQFVNLQRQLRSIQVGQVPAARVPYVGKPTGTIAALTGSTPGSGNVTLWELNSSGSLEATTIVKPAINLTTKAQAATDFVEMVKMRGTMCIIAPSSTTEDPTGVTQYAQIIEGYVNEDFDTSASSFEITINKAYQGIWPEDDMGDPLVTTEVLNYERATDPFSRGDYVFEGEEGLAVLANLDPEASIEASESGLVLIYRVDWVECAEHSPVSPGE